MSSCSQAVNQAVNQLHSQLVFQPPASQPVKQSVSQPGSQSLGWSFRQSVNRSIMSSCSCIVNQSYSQQQASQSIYHPVKQSVRQPGSQSVSMLLQVSAGWLTHSANRENGIGRPMVKLKLYSLKSFTFICCVRMSQLHYQGCPGFINLIQRRTYLVKNIERYELLPIRCLEFVIKTKHS